MFWGTWSLEAYGDCTKSQPNLPHTAKVFQGVKSKIRYCHEHQRICAKCEMVFPLRHDGSDWVDHLTEYVILIGLADVLFTDHNHRAHNGVDPNVVTPLVRY